MDLRHRLSWPIFIAENTSKARVLKPFDVGSDGRLSRVDFRLRLRLSIALLPSPVYTTGQWYCEQQ
jgi:hypothetical protein